MIGVCRYLELALPARLKAIGLHQLAHALFPDMNAACAEFAPYPRRHESSTRIEATPDRLLDHLRRKTVATVADLRHPGELWSRGQIRKAPRRDRASAIVDYELDE